MQPSVVLFKNGSKVPFSIYAKEQKSPPINREALQERGERREERGGDFLEINYY